MALGLVQLVPEGRGTAGVQRPILLQGVDQSADVF
jgi:hypothetical protein